MTRTPTRRAPRLTERGEQVVFVNWLRDIAPHIYLKLLPDGTFPYFHVPNGGARDPITGRRLKDEGVRRGVPDIFIPVPVGKFHGLWIEMKVKGGRVSDDQKSWLEYLTTAWYEAKVCYSAAEAIEAVKDYMTRGAL